MKIEDGDFNCWGWISSTGKVSCETYNTPNDAIEGMQSRVGRDKTLEELHRHGFRLALMKVSIKPLMVLDHIEQGA